MNCLELFKEFETKSFEANGFYAYDDFLEFGRRVGLSKKMVEMVLNSFIKNENRVLELIERSFLTPKAKERYVALYLDRLRAVRYRFIK